MMLMDERDYFFFLFRLIVQDILCSLQSHFPQLLHLLNNLVIEFEILILVNLLLLNALLPRVTTESGI